MIPYYEDGSVTLYLGDMREVLPELGQFDCAVTDPPYVETSLAWDRWPDRWPSIVAEHANSMWCFGSMRMFLERGDQFTVAWKLSQDVVWRKPYATGRTADRFRRQHELALHWYTGLWRDVHHEAQRENFPGKPRKPRKRNAEDAEWHGRFGEHVWVDDGTRLMKSVIDAQNLWSRGAIHPTEKPVEILRPLVAYACPPGGVVLDPFAGSGSTAEAARQLGRRAVLIEASEEYCERIAGRMTVPQPE